MEGEVSGAQPCLKSAGRESRHRVGCGEGVESAPEGKSHPWRGTASVSHFVWLWLGWGPGWCLHPLILGVLSKHCLCFSRVEGCLKLIAEMHGAVGHFHPHPEKPPHPSQTLTYVLCLSEIPPVFSKALFFLKGVGHISGVSTPLSGVNMGRGLLAVRSCSPSGSKPDLNKQQ